MHHQSDERTSWHLIAGLHYEYVGSQSSDVDGASPNSSAVFVDDIMRCTFDDRRCGTDQLELVNGMGSPDVLCTPRSRRKDDGAE